MPLSRADVEAAAGRLQGLVVRTPVIRSEAIDELCGAEIYFKAESLQRIGAFKARGAMHAVGRLTKAERARGIITYSSGNHAQAVALAAKHYGITAEIAMPVDAPKIKIEVVRKLGARITLAGRTSLDRRQAALKIEARTGGVIIEPFDHADTICGQGTATLELLAQLEELGVNLDALLVPVGGGGLIAGACLAAQDRDLDICAVEPVGCDSMRQSIEAGQVMAVEPGPTLADGLKPTRVGKLCFEIARERLARCFTVDDDEIARALTTMVVRGKLVIEPSAAATVAVCLRRALPEARRIGVILSGGNVAPDLLAKLLRAGRS